jgi:hypothetical protein
MIRTSEAVGSKWPKSFGHERKSLKNNLLESATANDDNVALIEAARTAMTSPMDNPGSANALARGCTCDLIKNDFGRGKREPDGIAFHCSEACPVHGALKAIVRPTTIGGLFTYEYPTALKWLKTRVSRFRKGSADQ